MRFTRGFQRNRKGLHIELSPALDTPKVYLIRVVTFVRYVPGFFVLYNMRRDQYYFFLGEFFE